mmetsp:Transcript_26744/g.37570  ORF Transcript_26744/g.37570 Transcript_26744/m.37570 type:complete len:283 (+) Transcript_26744:620-1468(+)
MGDSSTNFFICRSGSTVHDKEDGFVILACKLFLGISLMATKTFGLESDITGLVDTVDITEGSSNREHGTNLGECLVDRVNLFGTGVQLFGVNIFIVDTILFTSSDTNFHLQPNLHGYHALEVLDANSNVLVIRFFGQIQHVRGVKRFTVLCKVSLVSLKHGIEPRQKLLCAVIRMKNNGDTVVSGDSTDVKCHGNGTSSSLVDIRDTLSGEEGGSSVGALDHHGGVVLHGSFQDSIAHGRTGTVESGDGISVGTSMLKKLQEVVAGHNSGGNITRVDHFEQG